MIQRGTIVVLSVSRLLASYKKNLCKKGEAEFMSNTDIVKAGLTAWEKDDTATLSALVEDDFSLTGPVPQPLGKQDFLGLMHVLHEAMPDFAFNISSFEEAGDRVIARSHIS